MGVTGMGIVCSCVLWLLLARPLLTVPQCDHYGTCRTNYPFLPAPPGRVPPCAKPGSTFCEKLDHYPTQLIRYLIERWGYDYSTLLSDESRDDFNYRTPVTYGPPQHPGYSYGPPKVPTLSYYPAVQLVGNVSSGGYPDRRYKLPAQYLSTGPYLYTTLLQPATQYNPDDWWERYARSNSEGSIGSNHQQGHSRKRRQAGGNQLCPTRTEFIMPKAAMNNRGNWMYVVNLNEVDDRYTQLVGTETCTTSQCSGLCSVPGGYSSRCQQQYVQKRLVALEGGGDRLYTDIFWFPHCCTCQVTQNNG
ncbi:protein spaetzle 5-like isoform X2 [Periplaneta americana]|uniref:protein spaetzle 5-like isoform X2 n=1 Tax=Periplaneta americana TaxID=6978 RepID=UPI0037E765D4